MSTLALKDDARESFRQDKLLERLGPLDSEEQLGILIRRIFPNRIAVLSSFGAESAVLLDMVARIDATTPVIFLDTGMLFPQTLAYKDVLQERLGLKNILTVNPASSAVQDFDPDGDLHKRDHDFCCTLRKVNPLALALRGFNALVTGRKRYHGGQRSVLPTIEQVDGLIKHNPLADWTEMQIDDAFDQRGLPRHPLTFDNYQSLGCAPCTQKTQCASNIRAGRWAGSNKTECGIHNTGKI